MVWIGYVVTFKYILTTGTEDQSLDALKRLPSSPWIERDKAASQPRSCLAPLRES